MMLYHNQKVRTSIICVLFTVVLCISLLAGCGPKLEEEPLAVYTFSGKNEICSISNGVIVLTSEQEIFYGGVLDGEVPKVVAYTMTFYIRSGSDDIVLLSNSVTDTTGGTIDIAGEMGKVSGDILKKAETDDLRNNLYFELTTTNLDGEETTYQLQLSVTEVTSVKDG